jgi:hypothetical protein
MTEFDLDSIKPYSLELQTKTKTVLGRTKRQEEALQSFLEEHYA